MFRRRTPEAAPFIAHAADGEDLVLSMSRGADAVAVRDWASVSPQAGPALAEALAAAEDGRVGPDGRNLVEVEPNRVRLHPAWVAALDGQGAHGLGLPAPTPFALDLKPVGRIDEEDFRIEARWVRPGGQPARATLRGALLATDSGSRRVPEPLWSLHRAAQVLAAPLEKAARFQALANLRAYWPEDARAQIESDRYLSDLRAHYASGLSLKLRALTPNRTDFDPVLFGARALAEADEEGRAPDEDLDNILTPAAQKLFAEDRFRREAQARSVYVLRDREYVFVDPALQPALDAVRKLQDRPEAERRAFVLNPRRVLRDRLGDETADRIGLDRLFVETEQFSARVAGVDVWRAPVLPWLAPAGKNRWLPERFGIRVGDDYFVLPPENVSTVIERVETAAARNERTAAVPGLLEPASADGPPPPSALPVNEQVLEAVKSFEPFAKALQDGAGGMEEAGAAFKEAVAGKLFLVVRENLEEVEFAPFEGAAAAEPPPVSAVPAPERLRATLKPHQIDGLTWLARSSEAGRLGVLLADDMGLGKTLQAIAFMAWLQQEAAAGRRPSAPFLIVAPTGLLGNWRQEIERHLSAPHLGPLLPAFGSELKRLREEDGFGAKDIETGRAALSSEAWRDAGVVLTTYETLRDYHFSFARTRFGLIVYDEIQKLKNPASQLTRAAKTLNATFTLGMTGTPVENRLQDLWSIMDVVSPGLLGSSRDFEKRHPVDDPAALARLKGALTEPREGRPPYMLRRLKADALESMPAKHVHTFEADMPHAQANAYRDLVVRAAAGSAGGTMGKGGMLATLAAMRGVSLHPLDPRLAPADLDLYARDSARLSRTLAVLQDVAAKCEKALIFVEDLAMQERLAGLIQARFQLPSAPMRINGSVPGPRRQEMVEAFQSVRDRFDVMILSPKAGGVGLTLTAANHVIHLSRWWNPAVEDQATDRVFRIGQTRDVHVHLPLAVHPDPAIRESSFDLRLNALIERKRRLTRDLFLPPDAGDADLADLFREVSLSGDEAQGESRGRADPEADVEAAPVAEVAVLAPEPPPRPVLTLPRHAAESGAKVWRVEAGRARPTDEIVSVFTGRDLVHVLISDPYALGSRAAREAQIRFVSDLAAKARTLEAVTVEYAPDVDGDLDDAGCRRAIGELFAWSFPGGGPRFQPRRRLRRTRDDDFHDRSIDFDVRHAGGAVRRHALLIGRGVQALYDERHACTVTYAPPASET